MYFIFLDNKSENNRPGFHNWQLLGTCETDTAQRIVEVSINLQNIGGDHQHLFRPDFKLGDDRLDVYWFDADTLLGYMNTDKGLMFCQVYNIKSEKQRFYIGVTDIFGRLSSKRLRDEKMITKLQEILKKCLAQI